MGPYHHRVQAGKQAIKEEEDVGEDGERCASRSRADEGDELARMLASGNAIIIKGHGVVTTGKNIDEALKSKKPDVMRLVGTEGAYGEDLGLTKDWAARIIRHVGNYGEVYDRNVGKLGIPRGLNQLWSAGGIQYAPPIR